MAIVRGFAGAMSKVFSFRLDTDNPREAQAREVIEVLISQGYSLRHIITEALIYFRDKESPTAGWEKVYDKLSEILHGLENGGVKKQTKDHGSALSPSFIEAMKNSVKDGKKFCSR